MSRNKSGNSSRFRWSELYLPVLFLGCLFIIFVPMPARALDLLLAANITAAVIILLTTLQVRRPLEMSLFPSLLLGTTLARLALNVSTTRLILTDGATEGDMAAGGVIQSFGQLVGGNNIAIGLVIFAIIIVIQFVVITKGASRISEVAARFSLDGMPGKQMSIDADLNAGVITADEATLRREELAAQADFYGSMDGASKFVRGDAIAGVLITVINIAGGLIIGIAGGMTISQAGSVFTRLTIGDGLASQIPALLIALAAGVLVSRSTREVNLPDESAKQLLSDPRVLLVTAAFLVALTLTGLPVLPLLLLAGACTVLAAFANEARKKTAAAVTVQPAAAPRSADMTIEKLLTSDVVEMELGAGLIKLADPKSGGSLLSSISRVRQEFAADMGVILPKVRVRDNLQLQPNEFRILLHGNPVERSEIQPAALLAVDEGRAREPVEPEFVKGIFGDGSPAAYWISPDAHTRATQSGYVVMTPTEVLAAQLQRVSIERADELLTRDSVKQLIDETRKSSPAVVDGLIPDQMSLNDVQRVLKQLVAEEVSIRPLGLILETMGDHANSARDHYALVEQIRMKLAPHIVGRLTSPGEPLQTFTIEEDLEHRVACAWEREDGRLKLDLSRHVVEGLARAIEQAARNMRAAGKQPVAVVDQTIRPVIAELGSVTAQDLIVLGDREIEGCEIEVIGEITIDDVRDPETMAA